MNKREILSQAIVLSGDGPGLIQFLVCDWFSLLPRSLATQLYPNLLSTKIQIKSFSKKKKFKSNQVGYAHSLTTKI